MNVTKTKRFRTTGVCLCNDQWHRLSMTRDGRLVPLDHTPREIRRWRALAELGGEVPFCIALSDIDPTQLKNWDTVQRGHKVSQVLKQIGRVLRLRAERHSARDFPGQGKRNRKSVPPEPRSRPKRQPPPEPTDPELQWWNFFHRWYCDRVHSKYRRQVLYRKYAGPSYKRHGKCKMRFENPDKPPGMRKR